MNLLKKIISILILVFVFQYLDTCEISAALNSTNTITKAQIENCIKEFVENNISESAIKFEIEFRNIPDSIKIPAGNVNIDIKRSHKKELKSYVVLHILISVNQKLVQDKVVNIKIHTFENVLTAKKNIKRHTILNDENIAIKYYETTTVNRAFYNSENQIAGQRSNRFIVAGSIIKVDMLEPIPLIERDEIVTLLYQYDNIMITVLGKALEDGIKNDIIKVKNLDSNARLKGEIIDKKKVLVCEKSF